MKLSLTGDMQRETTLQTNKQDNKLAEHAVVSEEKTSCKS